MCIHIELTRKDTLLTLSSQLMSRTSSGVILQLNENRQEIESLVTRLNALSFQVPVELHQKITNVLEISTLVAEVAQFNIEEVHRISLGMSGFQERILGGSTTTMDRATD